MSLVFNSFTLFSCILHIFGCNWALIDRLNKPTHNINNMTAPSTEPFSCTDADSGCSLATCLALSHQHWSRVCLFFPYMLTGSLTTRDFVRLTNRSPSLSLMSFEHFIAIWPAVLEPQREWSMMETLYKKKINQTHFTSNIVRERGQSCGWEVQRIICLTLGGRSDNTLWDFMAEKLLTHFIFPTQW